MMSPAIVTDSKQTSLMREAAEWRLTGLLLECPTEGWPEQVSALAAEVEDADLKAAAEAAQQEATYDQLDRTSSLLASANARA